MIGAPGAMAWPSPNFGPRRGDATPDLIVLHYTAMPSEEAARDWLCDPKSQVSAHYVIARDGRLWQLVCERDRAWHAGAGAWGPVTDVNSRSIGIELCNDGAEPFPEPLMGRLEGVLRQCMARWRIPRERVVAHSDTAVGRKIDPGPRFDWARLARQGLAIVATGASDASVPFAASARRIGYRWDDGAEDAALSAFRLRFRPGATGTEDAADRAMAASVAANYPARQT